MKYLHKEAFCLMQYQCQSCGKEEDLWNSRDGVTPFSVGCPDCKQIMEHINFGSDYCVPGLKPWPGLRVFVDCTIKQYREHQSKYVDRIWEQEIKGFGSAKDKYESKDVLIKSLMSGFKVGGPHIHLTTLTGAIPND